MVRIQPERLVELIERFELAVQLVEQQAEFDPQGRDIRSAFDRLTRRRLRLTKPPKPTQRRNSTLQRSTVGRVKGKTVLISPQRGLIVVLVIVDVAQLHPKGR